MWKRVGTLLLAALPLFGAGHDLTPPTLGTSVYNLGPPVVASNGDTFLTLWTSEVPSAGPYVFASMANADGKVVTPLSYVLCPLARVIQVFPAGKNYVALLTDYRGAYRVATIAPDGTLLRLGPAGDVAEYSYDNKIAFDGNRFFLVGRVSVFTVSITLSRRVIRTIDQNGRVSEQPMSAPADSYDVRYDPSGAFVLYTSGSDGLSYQRYAGSGFALSPREPFTSLASCSALAVSTNGATFAVACSNRDSRSPDYGLTVAIISPDGTTIGRSKQSAAPDQVRLYWTSNGYVLMSGGVQYTASRIDQQGDITDVVVLSTGIASASNGRTIFAAGYSGTSRQIVANPVVVSAQELQAATPDTLSYTYRRQSVDSIHSDRVDFITTWTDQTAANIQQTSGRYLSAKGIPFDPGQSDLGAGTSRSSVAFGNSVSLIVWQQGPQVVARRVSPGGGFLDAEPIVVAKGSLTERSVAWDGRRFIVIWNAAGSGFATFIGEDGGKSAPTLIPGTGPVTWTGQHFLVASYYYSSFGCTCPPLREGIQIDRLTVDGLPVDSLRLPGAASGFHIASGPHESVIVVHYGGSVYARVIRSGSGVLAVDDAVLIAQWYGGGLSDVAWNGSSYTIAWHGGYADSWWLSTIRFSPPKLVIEDRIVAVGPADGSPPAIDVAASGASVIVISEVPDAIGVARVRAYAETDLHSTALKPPAPVIKTAVMSPAVMPVGTDKNSGKTQTTVTWESDAPNIAGFAIESVSGEYATPVALVGADVREATVLSVPHVRVRAFGPMGISDPSATLDAQFAPRRRSVLH
jgi:hypothetical protein